MSGSAGTVVQAKLVHDPVRFDAVGGAALIEHERFAHADESVELGADGFVTSRRLPEPPRGGAVRSVPRRVLLVLPTKKVAVALLLCGVCLDLTQLCNQQQFPVNHHSSCAGLPVFKPK